MKYSDRPNAYINAKDLEIAIVKATSYGDALDAVREAPSIDIIRCGECKHRKPSVCVGSIKTYECDITGFRMHDLTNHFCSYGERNDNGF